jgi:hypothetical protein
MDLVEKIDPSNLIINFIGKVETVELVVDMWGFSMLDSSADCKALLLRDVFEYITWLYKSKRKLDGNFGEIWNEFLKPTPGSQDCDALEGEWWRGRYVQSPVRFGECGWNIYYTSLQYGNDTRDSVLHLLLQDALLGKYTYKRTAEENTNSLEKEEEFGEDNEATTTPTMKREQADIVFEPEEKTAPGLDIVEEGGERRSKAREKAPCRSGNRIGIIRFLRIGMR